MSLFGKPLGGATGGSSLFGSQQPASTGSGQMGGLFGSTAAAPKPGGLFGTGAAATTTTTTTTQAPAGGSLFGGASTTTQQPQATGGGLFGTAAAATQPKPGGLFGASTTATSQPQGGGLFGTSAAPAQPQKPPLFGATQTATTTSAPFGASILSNNNPAASTNGLPSQPSGAYFDSLLAKSKKQAEGESSEQLPSLQLGLGDLRQKLRKLGPQAQTRAVDGKAHYLLAASGVDPGAAVRDLGAFGIHAGRDRSQAVASGELDVETYLSNLQTKTTLGMIADGLERSVRDFDSFLEDNVTMEWEAQRKRIYQHFGIKPREDVGGAATTPSKDGAGGFGRSRRSRNPSTTPAPRSTQRGSTFGRSNLQKSIIGTPSKIGAHPPEFSDVEFGADNAGSMNGLASMDDRFLREKQAKLADKIRSLNDSRVLHQPYPILYELAGVEAKSGDRHAQNIVDAFKAVMEMVGEDPDADPTVRGATARERQFAKTYLDPNPNSQNASAMRKRILTGANRHLERQFWSEVEASIAKNPQEAALGGRPDVISKIKAFVRLRAAHKNLVPDNTFVQEINGEPVWAVVFYLLRTGHVNEAAKFVNDNQNHFRSIDRTFASYINSYATSEDRRLKRQMQERCNNEYNQRVRNAPEGSIDPFRMACYKIIGRCEVSNRSLDGLHQDVNDWIWLQFNLAREGDRSAELANEMYGLAELQGSIKEIGLKHFPKNSTEDTNGSFGMFFYLQILSGLFEQAIAYLYSFSYVDAVHFAIGLEYYGLLRAADALTAGNELLSHNTRGMPQINFGRMLGYYTRDFRAANVAAAVDYLVLICLNMDDISNELDKQQAALCHEALRELVLETREFSKLIGDIKPDGHRIKGLIEERGPLIALEHEQDFIKTISLQAASFADDNGRTTDAVLLYHLAGDYDTVVAIVSRALSEAISLEIGEDPMRLVPVKPRVEGAEAEAQPGSSLSLASLDDPVELARTMMTMYERDQMFRQRIREPNRVACSVLLQMSDIKGLVEAGKWPECLDDPPPPLLDLVTNLGDAVTENPGPRDPAAQRQGRPERDPQLRVQVLEPVAAGGDQRAQPAHVDRRVLHQAAGAAGGGPVQRQRVDGAHAGGRAQADERRPDDVHEPAAVPVPAAPARGAGEGVGGLGGRVERGLERFGVVLSFLCVWMDGWMGGRI
ncbi:uncharacterized protein E0L32_008071 [Thyridium curvatum]|uniref:Nuclear pore protein n=1 Tax=Thyridium curvatum TaxID=1093900 RepID=A0A507AX61_9PEZI|nr:uncharacterized protein E0L32_008071 [Thyridium curvatum]TPX11034.1 hypothetical protein E0L32_008071 [Thyridium curvatum]